MSENQPENEKSAAELANSIKENTKKLASKGIQQVKGQIAKIDKNAIKNRFKEGAESAKSKFKEGAESAKSKFKEGTEPVKKGTNSIDFKKVIAPLESKIALGLFISFFLPWIAFGPISANGFSIPGAIKDLSTMVSAVDETTDVSGIWIYFLLYLIPIFSAVTIWMKYKNKSSLISSTIASGTLLFFFILTLIRTGSDFFNVISFGLILSVLLSIGLIVETYGLRHKFTKIIAGKFK